MTFRTCVECVWCFVVLEREKKLKECDEKVSQKTNCDRRSMFIRHRSGTKHAPVLHPNVYWHVIPIKQDT